MPEGTLGPFLFVDLHFDLLYNAFIDYMRAIMTANVATSWLGLLTPAVSEPPKKVGQRYVRDGRTSEAMNGIATRICRQMFTQTPPACEVDTLDRLRQEAHMHSGVAKSFIKKYKAEHGIN